MDATTEKDDIELAKSAFWAAIVTANPEYDDGDLDPEVEAAFDASCRAAVWSWKARNAPRDFPEILYRDGETAIVVARMPNGSVAITDDYLTDYVSFMKGGWQRESDQLPVTDEMSGFLAGLAKIECLNNEQLTNEVPK